MLTASTALASGCRPRADVARSQALPHQPNIIVWLADSLRADRLPCYGYPLDTAPAMSGFADQAIVFEQCYAAATWTTPATLSLLTGLPPLLHRTVVPEWSQAGLARGGQHQVLPEALPTTATLLRETGYDTAHFQANPNATREHGLNDGFNHYFYQLNAGYKEHTDAFLDWLQNEAREPFYAYVHLIDPHEPYSPEGDQFFALHNASIEARLARLPAREAQFLKDYHRQSWRGLFHENHRPGPELLGHFSKEGLAYLEALYTAEIRGVDGQFARVMEALDALGLRERTVVAVTSDHGEAFGENGLFYHGSGLHDPQIHIPLIMKLPGMETGVRCGKTVSQYDIHTTLMELAGAPLSEAYGRRLVNRRGELLPDGTRPVLACLDLNNPDPTEWRIRLSADQLRVETGIGPNRCIVSRTDSELPPKTISLADVGSLKDPAMRDAVEYFYTERHYLDQRAASLPEPGWFAPTPLNDDALKALGYL